MRPERIQCPEGELVYRPDADAWTLQSAASAAVVIPAARAVALLALMLGPAGAFARTSDAASSGYSAPAPADSR